MEVDLRRETRPAAFGDLLVCQRDRFAMLGALVVPVSSYLSENGLLRHHRYGRARASGSWRQSSYRPIRRWPGAAQQQSRFVADVLAATHSRPLTRSVNGSPGRLR